MRKFRRSPLSFSNLPPHWLGRIDNLIIPRNSTKTDWEVELAVVIGKKAKYVEKHEAMEYVAGYCVHNDYSERNFSSKETVSG